MRTAGQEAFEARSHARSGRYAYEQRDQARLSPALFRQFKANAGAWKYFQTQAPSYQRMTTYWVATAKQEATRTRRLGETDRPFRRRRDAAGALGAGRQ